MNYNWRRTLVLTMACFFLLAEYAPATQPARLIVRRTPNIGWNVIVQLFVDDAKVAVIGYGHTYEGFLTPGHHTLSVLATPDSKWKQRPAITVNAHSGQIYRFIAMGNNEGNLILRPAY